MTRKPLPKAITRSSADLRGIAAIATNGEAQASRPAVQYDTVEPETAPPRSPPPAANDLDPAASLQAEPQAQQRRAAARKIVDRHKNYAAVGGLLPLPIVNIAGVTAINMRMVKQLSDLYGVPFQRDRTRSLIVGLIGGAVPTGLGVAAASTLMYAVPVSGLVGLGVSAITAGALTRGIGLVFIESFESGTLPLGAAEAKPA